VISRKGRRLPIFLLAGIAVFIGLATIIILVLAFAHAWAPEVAPDLSKRCFESFKGAQWPKWIGCAMAAHENLAGGLIGAAGALFAAWLAYSVFQQQLAHEKDDRARLQAEAKLAAVMAMTQPVHAAGSTLDVIRKALAEEGLGLLGRAGHFDNIKFGMGQLRLALDHYSLKEVAKDLSGEDRAIFLMIVSQLGTIVNIAAQVSPKGDPAFHLRQQQRALEGVHKYLSVFDADLASVFTRDGGMTVAAKVAR
jgi:hypothetical protein